MIFASRNEAGEPAWKLVLERRKTVTRRLKPVENGKIIAVQPGRGKYAVCKIRVESCIRHMNWDFNTNTLSDYEEEARREGFETWVGLKEYLRSKGINILDTYRYEFEKIG